MNNRPGCQIHPLTKIDLFVRESTSVSVNLSSSVFKITFLLGSVGSLQTFGEIVFVFIIITLSPHIYVLSESYVVKDHSFQSLK